MDQNLKQPALKVEIAILVVVVALALAYFLTDGFSNQGPKNVRIVRKNVNAEEIIEKGKLPKGFPEDLPVEIVNIIESSSTSYMETGATAYSIRYKTDASQEEKYDEYLNYMTKAGYEFGELGKNKEQGVLLGKKGNDALSVTITSEDGATYVQLSVLDNRK